MAAGKAGQGVGGPWRGSIQSFQFQVATMYPGNAAHSHPMGAINIPAGAQFNVFNVQTWASASGSQGDSDNVARVTVFSQNTVICSETATATNAVTTGTLVAAVATAPGVPVGQAVPIVGGSTSTLRATASAQDCSTGPNYVTVTITGYWTDVPSSL